LETPARRRQAENMLSIGIAWTVNDNNRRTYDLLVVVQEE
jgi:hypothetical protein